MWNFKRIKINSLVILLLGLAPILCFGQVNEKEIIDSIFTYADSPSESRLLFIENCENAYIIANQDIKKQEVKLLIVGGISPTMYSTDIDFENKYQVTYYDYGDLAANSECMFNYNSKIFNFLTEKYGNSWKKGIRKDVYGYKEWKKKKKHEHTTKAHK